MENRTVIIKKDGDEWCAYREDFINLQESLFGFGDTEFEAMLRLKAEENYANCLVSNQEGQSSF